MPCKNRLNVLVFLFFATLSRTPCAVAPDPRLGNSALECWCAEVRTVTVLREAEFGQCCLFFPTVNLTIYQQAFSGLFVFKPFHISIDGLF